MITTSTAIHVSQLWTYEIAGDNIYFEERDLSPVSPRGGEMLVGWDARGAFWCGKVGKFVLS
jgi:hypothetical protein